MAVTPIAPSYASPGVSASTDLNSLKAERSRLEGEMRKITGAPKRPGESLNDEIKRKREASREVRDKLKEVNNKIAKLEEKAAASKPASLTPKKDYDAKDYVNYGPGSYPVDRPSDVKDAPKDRPGDEWVKGSTGVSRTSDNPDERGWWVDGRGHEHGTLWKRKKTDCKPCQGLVKYFNGMMVSVLISRQQVHYLISNRAAAIKQRTAEIKDQAKRLTSFNKSTETAAALVLLDDIQAYENWYDAQIATEKADLADLEKTMAKLAKQIAECEKQCAPKDGEEGGKTTGITAGWADRIITIPGGTADSAVSTLPMNWKGPYITCPPCQKFADKLNPLEKLAHEKMKDLYYAKLHLKKYEMDRKHFAAWDAYEDSIDIDDERPGDAESRVKDLDKKIEKKKNEIKKLESHLQQIAAYHDKILAMLVQCEKEVCPKQTKDRRIGCLLPLNPGTSLPASHTGGTTDDTMLCSIESVEIEYTVSQFGTNAFDAYEIERVPDMVNGTDNTVVVTPTTPTVTTPTTPTTPVTETPTTPTTPTTPVTTPLAVTTSGTSNFSHTVGTTGCPTDAGTITVTSNNGNPLSVGALSVSGTLMTRLTTSVIGSGTATPMISTQFNCSSSDNGTFTGNITGTVTDTVTNETATVSIPASGTVTGP